MPKNKYIFDDPSSEDMSATINNIIDEKMINKTKLAKKLGVSRQALAYTLSKEKLTIEEVRDILNAIGYYFYCELVEL